MKQCNKCNLFKEESEFKKGSYTNCKACVNERQRVWYSKNKDKALLQARSYYHGKKDKISDRRKADRKVNPHKYKRPNNPTKNKLYGWKRAGIKMTHEEYNRLLKVQNNKCAICNRNASEFKRKLDVDHNHKTGEVRGLLCVNCNRGIGHFQESGDLMMKAITYINRAT